MAKPNEIEEVGSEVFLPDGSNFGGMIPDNPIPDLMRHGIEAAQDITSGAETVLFYALHGGAGTLGALANVAIDHVRASGRMIKESFRPGSVPYDETLEDRKAFTRTVGFAVGAGLVMWGIKRARRSKE